MGKYLQENDESLNVYGEEIATTLKELNSFSLPPSMVISIKDLLSGEASESPEPTAEEIALYEEYEKHFSEMLEKIYSGKVYVLTGSDGQILMHERKGDKTYSILAFTTFDRALAYGYDGGISIRTVRSLGEYVVAHKQVRRILINPTKDGKESSDGTILHGPF